MNMQEFLNKLTADQALAGKMSKATDPDNAYAIAKAAGLTETFDAFTAAMKKLNDAAGDINADEADKIAGGAGISTPNTAIFPTDGPILPNNTTAASAI